MNFFKIKNVRDIGGIEMIEKIINNYLTNALIRCFKTTALLRNIELHIIPRKNEVSVYAKDRKYTKNFYIIISYTFFY